METKNMMNMVELTEYLRISESTVRKLISNRDIPFIRIYKKLFFKKEAIDKWIDHDMTTIYRQVDWEIPNYDLPEYRRKKVKNVKVSKKN
jgi:excisionase family DNA binding protein